MQQKANTTMDLLELIYELYCSYWIQESSREKDDDKTDTGLALLVVNFCRK